MAKPVQSNSNNKPYSLVREQIDLHKNLKKVNLGLWLAVFGLLVYAYITKEGNDAK